MNTPAEQLDELITRSDHLSVDSDGNLLIDEVPAPDLLRQFGSPLFVIAENTLRDNYRRIRNAFADAWPESVNVMFAIKANTNLAVRAILHQEGAGGDCFGEGELYATFKGGAEPKKIALNGSNKTTRSLSIAVENGITVNIDADDEIDRLALICREKHATVNVNIRLKAVSESYNSTQTDYFGGTHLAEYVRRCKWGYSADTAEQLILQIQNTPELCLTGFSFHIGRVSQGLEFLKHFGRALGSLVVELHLRTGFSPQVLDIGGGWARERDPESKTLDLHMTTVEECTEAACEEILGCLRKADISIPDLWAEPGRYIAGNASVLLATVGSIKHDLDQTWVNIDASTNDLPRIDTSGSAYHVLAANDMFSEANELVDVVGPTCTDSIIGRDRKMPKRKAGDIVAVLDAGMYSESASTQFNSVPRPATVLVNGSKAELIKEREQVEDLFRLQRIPARLQNAQ